MGERGQHAHAACLKRRPCFPALTPVSTRPTVLAASLYAALTTCIIAHGDDWAIAASQDDAAARRRHKTLNGRLRRYADEIRRRAMLRGWPP